MLLDVIVRKNAISVEEDHERCHAGLCTVVAAPSSAKSLMLLGHKPDWEIDRPRKLEHNVGRMVVRPVVGNYDLEPLVHIALQCQRQQRAPQVLWALKCGDDYGDFRLYRQGGNLPARESGLVPDGVPRTVGGNGLRMNDEAAAPGLDNPQLPPRIYSSG